MGTNNKNKKTEDGWLLRPIAGPTDLSTSTKLGPTEEEVLIERYSALSDWLSEVKALEKRGRIELNSYLKTAMAKAKTDGRVRDCSHETALRLGGTHTGPDLLLFFVRKCPHYRDAFLRGELPPYPWRISQPFEKEQKPAGTKPDITPDKRRRILTWVKGFLKEAYRITIKSFFDSVMNK